MKNKIKLTDYEQKLLKTAKKTSSREWIPRPAVFDDRTKYKRSREKDRERRTRDDY